MKKRILVKGPVLSQSGYGEQSRFALRALRSQEDKFEIYINPITWGKTGWIWTDDEFRHWMDERITKTSILAQNNQLQVDMSLQVTIPTEWEKIAPINIGYTAGIETTGVAPQWVPKGNEMDKILVVSEHAKQTYVETPVSAKNTQTGEIVKLNLTTPVSVVHETTPQADPEPIESLDLKTDFNFLLVSQWSIRKNFENTIKWWVEEFIDQEVGLVIKSNTARNCIMDSDVTFRRIKSLLAPYEDRKCKVYLLHGDLTDGQMTWLYRHDKIKAMINIAHGEGFGLPLFEAAREALPIVTVGWSGQLDFLKHGGADYFQKVNHTLQPIQNEAVWPGVLEEGTQWAYADQGSYKMVLRRTKKDWEKAKNTALELQKLVQEKFNKEVLFEGFCNSVLGKSTTKPIPVEAVSFCIPTNGAKPDKTLLTINSIKKEMGDFPHEIVIAGDTEKFKDIEGVKLVDRSEEAHSRKVALLRNAAADNSKYKTIAFCDDDIIINPGWLQGLREHSEDCGWDVLANIVLCPDGTRYWDRAAFNPHRLVDYDHPDYDKNLYQSSAFFLVRRSVFDNVRWDETKLVYADREGGIPEDVQYSADLHKKEYNFSFNSKSTVWHNDDSYTEFSTGGQTLTLKKEVLSEKFDMHFFLPPEEEFENLVGSFE